MNTSRMLILIREVVLRFVVAILGYFVIFSVYLFLFTAHAKHVLGISAILKISAITLALPFMDLVRYPILLFRLSHVPKVAAGHTFHVEIVKILITGIGMELGLFVCSVAAVVAFERSVKTRASIIFFYACMPALLWILWSQLYLFLG